ncbi:MAG: helix-turn-helix domain-containing protein [Humidesulfovibrio sp.]
MPRKTREIDPAVQAAFDAAMERIKAVTGARTQVQLADVLEVRQSSISDAKRRASIPDGWLVKLLRTHRVMPDWIEHGAQPQYLDASTHEVLAELGQTVRALTEDVVRLMASVDQNLDIIKMTEAELQRRKGLHVGRLVEDLVRAHDIAGRLKDVRAAVAGLIRQ